MCNNCNRTIYIWQLAGISNLKFLDISIIYQYFTNWPAPEWTIERLMVHIATIKRFCDVQDDVQRQYVEKPGYLKAAKSTTHNLYM